MRSLKRSWVAVAIRRVIVGIALVFVCLLAIRIYDSQRGAPLEIWHTFAPHELDADEIDHADWQTYLAAKKRVFDEVYQNVTRTLDEHDPIPVNRYYSRSPIYPGHFAHDWNRSYEIEPQGDPVGAVVLLHGLTDAPYSLRHIAEAYSQHGFVAVGIRLPGHGTVPGGLADVGWEDWGAATRLAVREARRRIGPDKPLHIVGFSNGGALAVEYALEALDNPSLSKPDRLILISPMIGITSFARFAGLAGLPALLPHFAKAAWLSVLPEFNPFKYNSFPVNGARQSYLLTDYLQRNIVAHVRSGRLKDFPPVLTFQSVLDATVSTRAIIADFYAHLPANGSELVLFDINRNSALDPLLSAASEMLLARLLPRPPRSFTTTIVGNVGPGRGDIVARTIAAGALDEHEQPLSLVYPPDVFSLSHVALPFPLGDSLYGLRPDPSDEQFGIHLGAIAARGERGTLIVNLDSILRMSSNPFFPYMITRIEDGLDEARLPASARPAQAVGADNR